MLLKENPSTFVDSTFLLYAHMVCADEQIHIKESQKLDELAEKFGINTSTREEMNKILSQRYYEPVF